MVKFNPGLGAKTGHKEQIFPVTETQLTNDEIVAAIETQTTIKKALIVTELTGTLSSSVVSFNGATGAVVGVGSWNGFTGAVSFTQYVSAVDGVTGSVTSFDGGSFT